MSIHHKLKVAIEAGKAAGAIAMAGFGQLETGDIEHKGAVDLLTRIDSESEAQILKTLQDAFPDDAVLGEEGGRWGPDDARFLWVVDPLDGTTNYVHRSMHFAVSIGLVDVASGEPVGGVIHAPSYAQTWVGSPRGAFRIDHRLQEQVTPVKVSGCRVLRDALLATGFPYDRAKHAEALLAPVRRVLEQARGLRRMGAASLDFVNVAQGVFDGFFEFRLAPWDMAAGVALVRAAGGVVTGADGSVFALDSPGVLAAGPTLHPAILRDILQVAQTDASSSERS